MPSAIGRPARGRRVGEDSQSHAVERGEGDVCDRPGQPLGRDRLVGAAPVHRAAQVDEQVERKLLLGDEQPEHEAVEPGVGVPVDQPVVISGRVVAEVRELRRAAPVHRPPLTAHLAFDGAAHDHGQRFESS